MVLLNEGRYNLETEALLEIALAEVPVEALTGPDADLAIDVYLEILAVE